MATATATRSRGKKSTRVNFSPLDDRVLLQPADPEEKTSGGIILPDSAQERQQRGTVVAVGPGKLLDSGARGEMSVHAGDEVFWGKYAGTEIEIEGEQYTICRETDILAVIE